MPTPKDVLANEPELDPEDRAAAFKRCHRMLDLAEENDWLFEVIVAELKDEGPHGYGLSVSSGGCIQPDELYSIAQRRYARSLG